MGEPSIGESCAFSPPQSKPALIGERLMTDPAIEAMARGVALWQCAKWDAASFTETPNGEDPDDMRAGFLEMSQAVLTAYHAHLEATGFAVVPVALVREACGECPRSLPARRDLTAMIAAAKPNTDAREDG